MNYLDSLYWILEREKHGIKPGIKRMQWMLDAMDNPQDNIKGIHVVGTNGKGSTVTFLRSALVHNGYEVGTFTSPHIDTFNERISINGKPISDDDIAFIATKVREVVEQLETQTTLGAPTEFEVITMMMFYYFGAVRTVDFVVVEAGLGALNDSTNVFKPILSILTSISLDHTNILGETMLDIAKDKGAVVKLGVPFVYHVDDLEIEGYMNDVVEKNHTKGIKLNRDFVVVHNEKEFNFRWNEYEFNDIELEMKGTHQHNNASLAIASLVELHKRGVATIDFNKMIDGIEEAKWQGRIETIREEPLTIVDGAHNTESIQALIDTMEMYYPDREITILFSAIDGKPIRTMIEQLEPIAKEFFVTTFDYPKALPADSLYEEGDHDYKGIVKDYREFIEHFEGDLLLVTGSLYFVSQVKEGMK